MVAFGYLVPGGFLPEEDQGYLLVNIQLPDAASIQRTDDIAQQAEKILMTIPEVEYTTTVAGYSLLSGSFSTNTAFLFISLKDWSTRERTAKQVTDAINAQFFMRIKGAEAFAFGPPAIPGLGNGSGFTMMLQDRSGNPPEYLAQEAQKFIAAATARDEIQSVFTTYRANVPQRELSIDTERALRMGVNLNDLYQTVGAYLGGAYINDFNRFGRLYKAYVQADPAARQSPDQIGLFYIRNRDGDPIPLSTLVNVSESTGPEFTSRFNLYRAAELSGAPAPGYTSSDALTALEEVAAEVLPAGMGYEWANMSYQEKEASGSVGIIFGFSLLFVFLILAAQYESWSLPFSILLGTPFAICGALMAIYLARLGSTSYLNNIFTQISLVMLIAMAAKNAILIIEFAKMKFEEGMSLRDAALESAKLRFRPILMTVFSFILGILPLLIATGAGAEARKVMGMALFGGMMLATLLGVFMYPLLFIFIGNLAGYEKKRKLTTQSDA